jgi:hypothetical protein
MADKSPIALDIEQALADFHELRELAALQFFDLFSLLRELDDAGTSVFCIEVDSSPAILTSSGVVRYKLADPLLACLTAMRARNVHLEKVEGASRHF